MRDQLHVMVGDPDLQTNQYMSKSAWIIRSSTPSCYIQYTLGILVICPNTLLAVRECYFMGFKDQGI